MPQVTTATYLCAPATTLLGGKDAPEKQQDCLSEHWLIEA